MMMIVNDDDGDDNNIHNIHNDVGCIGTTW